MPDDWPMLAVLGLWGLLILGMLGAFVVLSTCLGIETWTSTDCDTIVYRVTG